MFRWHFYKISFLALMDCKKTILEMLQLDGYSAGSLELSESGNTAHVIVIMLIIIIAVIIISVHFISFHF